MQATRFLICIYTYILTSHFKIFQIFFLKCIDIFNIKKILYVSALISTYRHSGNTNVRMSSSWWKGSHNLCKLQDSIYIYIYIYTGWLLLKLRFQKSITLKLLVRPDGLAEQSWGNGILFSEGRKIVQKFRVMSGKD